jgi:hypothetical protein
MTKWKSTWMTNQGQISEGMFCKQGRRGSTSHRALRHFNHIGNSLATRPEESYRVSVCVWSRNPEKGGQRSILDYKRLWMNSLADIKLFNPWREEEDGESNERIIINQQFVGKYKEIPCRKKRRSTKLMTKYKANGMRKKGQTLKTLRLLWQKQDNIWPISDSFLATTVITTMMIIMVMILKVELVYIHVFKFNSNVQNQCLKI